MTDRIKRSTDEHLPRRCSTRQCLADSPLPPTDTLVPVLLLLLPPFSTTLSFTEEFSTTIAEPLNILAVHVELAPFPGRRDVDVCMVRIRSPVESDRWPSRGPLSIYQTCLIGVMRHPQ